MTAESILTIPALTDTNFEDWKLQIKVILKKEQYVLDTDPPEDAVGESIQNFLLADLNARKVIVLGLRQQRHFKLVKYSNSAKEMIEALRDDFDKTDAFSNLTLSKKLLSLKGGSSENLEAHFMKFESVIRELEGHGFEVQEQVQICLLLLSLPEEYNGFITTLETSAADTTLDSVKFRLLEEEISIKNRSLLSRSFSRLNSFTQFAEKVNCNAVVFSPSTEENLKSNNVFRHITNTDRGDGRRSEDSADKSAPVAPVHACSEEYNMNHSRRGDAVIFNHGPYRDDYKEERRGTYEDVKKLSVAFTNLGFDVTVYDNLFWKDIKGVLKDLSLKNHSDADCLAVVVLTHGDLDNVGYYFLAAYDREYLFEKLWAPFTADRCATLAGKPKLFFIQACRGDKEDEGSKLMYPMQADSGSRRPRRAGYKIPNYADFLFAFSTFEGFYSWRHPENGAYFIQRLCEELSEHGATVDLLKILTRVSRLVAIQYESNAQLKQVPSINSMLIREVYFRPKKEV